MDLSLLGDAGVCAWISLRSQDKSQSADRFDWNEYSNGVAVQRRDHGWRYAGEIFGVGTCVVLHHHEPHHKIYGQQGGYQIVFQLPKDVAVGDEFVLIPVPPVRQGEAQPHDKRYTLMLPGEFIAYTFGDHMGAMVAKSEIRKSKVIIKTMTNERVLIHAEIEVTIPEFYDLKIDRDFTLKRIPEDGG